MVQPSEYIIIPEINAQGCNRGSYRGDFCRIQVFFPHIFLAFVHFFAEFTHFFVEFTLVFVSNLGSFFFN